MFYELYAVLALGVLGWLLWWEMRPRFALVRVDMPPAASHDRAKTSSARPAMTLPSWWGPQPPEVATHANP